MKLPRPCISAGLLLAIAALTGCQSDPYALPPAVDSRVEYLPTIQAVEGRTLVLSDGRHVELRGITLAGLSVYELHVLSELVNWLPGGHCEVVPEGGDQRIVCYPSTYVRRGDPDEHAPSFMFMSYDGNTIRVVDSDLRAALLSGGLVQARLVEIADPGLRQRLANAEAYAKAHLSGIWRSLRHREQAAE